MGFKTVSYGDNNSIFTKNLEIGDVIEGAYLDIGTDKFDKNKYKFLLSKAITVLSKKKDDVELTPKTISPGEQVELFGGGGGLDFTMQGVNTGSTVRLTYNGKKSLEKGPYAGTAVHNWKVEVEETASSSRQKEAVPF
jgi:hypothetical protein